MSIKVQNFDKYFTYVDVNDTFTFKKAEVENLFLNVRLFEILKE